MNEQIIKEEWVKTLFLYVFRKPSYAIGIKNPLPGYFNYLYGVTNSSKLQSSMLDQGLIEKADLRVALTVLKLPILKSMATRYSLSSSGTKEKIIDRIMLAVDSSEIKKYLPQEVYVMSEQGKKFFEDHYVFVLMHRSPGWRINWLDVINEAEQKCKARMYDISLVRDIVLSRFNNMLINSDENSRSTTYQSMAEFYGSDFFKEKDDKKILELYLKALYYSMSGYLNFSIERANIEKYSGTKLKEILFGTISYDDYLYSNIKPYIECYSNEMMEKVLKISPSRIAFPKDKFKDIVESTLKDDFDQKFSSGKIKEQIVDIYFTCLIRV